MNISIRGLPSATVAVGPPDRPGARRPPRDGRAAGPLNRATVRIRRQVSLTVQLSESLTRFSCLTAGRPGAARRPGRGPLSLARAADRTAVGRAVIGPCTVVLKTFRSSHCRASDAATAASELPPGSDFTQAWAGAGASCGGHARRARRPGPGRRADSVIGRGRARAREPRARSLGVI